jgi:uncharacterized protein (TIGR03435 family)
VVLVGQDPAFEVATIKQSKSGDRLTGIQRQPGGRVTVTNIAPRTIIKFAYQLAAFQLVGGPAWMANDRFDIIAKLEGNPEFPGLGGGPDPIQLAMRTLLADRFKLKIRRETREMDIYALVLLKTGTPGPGLRPSTVDCKALANAPRRGGAPPPAPRATEPQPCSLMVGAGTIRMGGFPISQVATILSGQTERMVVDRTGLTGNWEFMLTFAAEQRGQPPPDDRRPDGPAPDPNAPSLFTALQEQLGLKLESTKAPVDVTVIDAIEHPTED